MVYIRTRIVLVRRCPLLYDASDGKQPILVVVGTGEQPECCPPAILQSFKLYKGAIGLCLCHTLPLILRTADVQWVIISDSSWYCHKIFNLKFEKYKCPKWVSG